MSVHLSKSPINFVWCLILGVANPSFLTPRLILLLLLPQRMEKQETWLLSFCIESLCRSESPVHTCIKSKTLDPMAIFFTSGTTGFPKMAKHSHGLALRSFFPSWYERGHQLRSWATDLGWSVYVYVYVYVLGKELLVELTLCRFCFLLSLVQTPKGVRSIGWQRHLNDKGGTFGSCLSTFTGGMEEMWVETAGILQTTQMTSPWVPVSSSRVWWGKIKCSSNVTLRDRSSPLLDCGQIWHRVSQSWTVREK